MIEIMERGLVEMRESGISHVKSSIMQKGKQLVDNPWKNKKWEIFEWRDQEISCWKKNHQNVVRKKGSIKIGYGHICGHQF